MGLIHVRDFSGGWQPGNDPINGAPNALLQMDNVDLDKNGALQLSGGTTVVGSAYTNNLHSLYSRTMNGTRKFYCGDTSGNIFRDNTSIGASGATDIAAFGTAFKYTLICSGNTRKKDDGSTAVNLGVGTPTVKPTVARTGAAPYNTIGDLLTNTVTPVGSSAVIGSAYLQMTADANGDVAVQTYDATSPVTYNCATLVNMAGGSSYGKDTDTVIFSGYTPNPYGKKLSISVLLTAPANTGDTVSDFFLYVIEDLATLQFEPTTGVFTASIKRNEFTRIGTGTQGWDTVKGFRLTYEGDASDVINILGYAASGTLIMNGGSSSQNGTYQYMQVNVNSTGTYYALSPMGPISDFIVIENRQGEITIQSPAAIDTQVNQVWLFRRGGLLEDWYRVNVFTDPTVTTQKYDDMDDESALKLGIRYNSNLSTIASTGVSDKILSIVGPINKRWYYFTDNMMYPSDVDNPDLVDTTIAIRTTGSNNEKFLWAKQVDKATVLVGTSVDVYVLSGTFATLPDFTIDIYYHGLGCKYPPITYDADVYAGSVFYLANDGWRFINSSGQNDSIVAPALDLLYKGITTNGYTAPNIKIAPGATRFPIVIAKNKLWLFITGTDRCEIFDLTRKYWRTLNYSTYITGALCATGTQDGQVVAFYDSDNKLREIDVTATKYIDADSTKKLRVALTWPVMDGGLPRNRKDSSNFKSRIYTGGSDTVSVTIVNEDGSGNIVGTLTSSTAGLDKSIDISQDTYVGLCKTYKVSMVGFVADFLLEDWTINFQERPEQRSFYRILPTNFGTAAKKRVRNWPLVIDTLGNTVTWTPDVDGTALSTTTSLSSSTKLTKNTFYTTDVFGVDYGGTLRASSGFFEFYEMLQPLVVQTLPIARRYDQIGPEEFFKYGKIKQFELRVMPDGGTSIPYAFYFSDTASTSGTLTVTDDKEDSYFIDVPKGTSGRIVRIVFGPTAFDFHRFYVRMQVADSGRDSEINWITIAND